MGALGGGRRRRVLAHHLRAPLARGTNQIFRRAPPAQQPRRPRPQPSPCRAPRPPPHTLRTVFFAVQRALALAGTPKPPTSRRATGLPVRRPRQRFGCGAEEGVGGDGGRGARPGRATMWELGRQATATVAGQEENTQKKKTHQTRATVTGLDGRAPRWGVRPPRPPTDLPGRRVIPSPLDVTRDGWRCRLGPMRDRRGCRQPANAPPLLAAQRLFPRRRAGALLGWGGGGGHEADFHVRLAPFPSPLPPPPLQAKGHSRPQTTQPPPSSGPPPPGAQRSVAPPPPLETPLHGGGVGGER